ncbi:bacteriohemerythrin [bacterium]|nr:bacteriohemerythrin [bacterium]
MKLRTKLFIPIFSILIILGLITGIFTRSVLSNIVEFVYRLSEQRIAMQIEKTAQSEINTIYDNIDRVGEKAVAQSLIFSNFPTVLNAYRLTYRGNIDNENDPVVRRARRVIKQEFKSVMSKYAQSTGKDLRLHFHLSNNHSFARIWREDWQAERNGEKVDISDDLSSFRKTVVKINQGNHDPIHGIEVGRGGFVIRGITSVTGPDGRHYGSCEVFFSFDDILKPSSKDDLNHYAYFMDARLLNIATEMKNNDRHPVLDNRYVLGSATSASLMLPLITSDFLDEGRKKLFSKTVEHFHLTGAPIRDFAGRTIGVAVLAQDITTQQETLQETRNSGIEAEYTLLWQITIGVFLALILVFVLLSILLGKVVIRPLDKCLKFADRISDGDLTVTLDISQKDEIGLLVDAFRKIVASFSNLVQRISGDIVQLSSNSNELSAISQQVLIGADHSSEKAQAVAVATEESSANMNTIAAASEEASTNLSETSNKIGRMNATINDIAQSTKRANSISDRAVMLVTSASEKVDALGKAAREINQVTEVISGISSKTDLLALNATVEAARAGEAGKGFAVVANEIKALANRTAASTKEIQLKIKGIQESTNNTVTEIKQIEEVIGEVHDIIFSISASVEEQAVTTGEITENMNHATIGINEVAQNIAQSSIVSSEIASDISSVSQATSEFTSSSTQINNSAEELATIARALKTELTRFKTVAQIPDEGAISVDRRSRSSIQHVTPLMRWDNSFILNIPEVDEQHKRLVDLVNQLHAAMKQKRDNSSVSEVLNGLSDYTVSHFSMEEKLMKQAGYDQLVAHQALHSDLVKQITDFKTKFEGGDAMVSMELMDFLKDWLTRHIKGTDKQYVPVVIEWQHQQKS